MDLYNYCTGYFLVADAVFSHCTSAGAVFSHIDGNHLFTVGGVTFYLNPKPDLMQSSEVPSAVSGLVFLRLRNS